MASKPLDKSHRNFGSFSSPSLHARLTVKSGSHTVLSDSLEVKTNTPLSKPNVKHLSSNQSRSNLKATKERLILPTLISVQKGLNHTVRSRTSKENTKRREISSSSRSSDTDSMSESDSDMSGSSSLTSTSESNSSQSSYSSSLPNIPEKLPVSDYRNEKRSPKIIGQCENHIMSKSDHKTNTNYPCSEFDESSVLLERAKDSYISKKSFQDSKDVLKHRSYSMKVSNSISPLSNRLNSKKELRSASLTKKSANSTKIHIGNLTRNILRTHLHEIFSNYGKIRSVDYPIDNISGFNQGYSYVDYYDFQSAADASNFMDEGYLDGQLISVKITHSIRRKSYPLRGVDRMSPCFGDRKRKWTPVNRRNGNSAFRMARTPISRPAPARFQRRKRNHTLSSSRSRTRSRSGSSHGHSAIKKYSKKLASIDNTRRYSRSTSSTRYHFSHSPLRKPRYRNRRENTSTSSYSTSSESS